MIVKQVTMQNFQNYEYQEIEFEEGVSLFHGENGSGKSTILRAIFAGLFQTKMTSESAVNYGLENLVKAGANEGSVTLTFTVGNDSYTVEWSIEKYNGEYRTKECVLNSPEGTISGVRAVTSEVENIIGMDARSFVNSVYIQQLDLTELISASASKKKQIFDGLLGFREIDSYIERSETAKREVKSLKRDAVTSLEEVEENHLSPLPTHEKINNKLQELQAKKDNIKEKINSISKKESQIETKLEEQQSIKQEIDSLQQSIETKNDQLSELQEKIDTKKEERVELKKQITSLENQISGLERKKEGLLESEDCEITAEEIPSDNLEKVVTEKISAIEESITTKEKRKAKIEGKIAQLRDTIQKNQSRKNEYEQEIQEKTERKSTIEDQLQDITQRISEKESQYEQAKEMVDEYIDQIESIVEQTTVECESEIESIKNDSIESSTDVTVKFERMLDRVSQTVESIQQEQKGIQSEIADSVEEKEDIETKIQNLDGEEQLMLEATFWNPYVEEISDQNVDENPTQIKKNIRSQLNEGSTLEELTSEACMLYNALMSENSKEYSDLVEQKESIQKFIKEEKEEKEKIEGKLTTLQELSSVVSEMEDYVTLMSSCKDKHRELSDKQNKLSEEQANIGEEIEKLKADIQDISSDTDAKNSAQNDLSSVTEELRPLKDKKSVLSDLLDVITAQNDLEERKINRENEKEEIVEEISTIREEIDTVKTELSDHKESISEYKSKQTKNPEKLSKQLEKLQDKIQKQEQKKETVLEKIASLKSKRDRRNKIESRVNELEDTISQLATRKTELERMISIYSGVKDEYRKQAITYINKYTNEIFSKLYTNQQYTRVEIDTEYNVTLHTQGTETINPEFSSGGEGAIVNIAIRAGIYRVLNEQSEGTKLPPFILDEPTTFLDDNHIDELENFVSVLREWNVPQVFIVSHEELLIDTADILYETELDENNNSTTRKVY